MQGQSPGALPREEGVLAREEAALTEVAYWSFQMVWTFLDLWK